MMSFNEYCKASSIKDLVWSANAGSGIVFFRKFRIDFNKAARCGKHWFFCMATLPEVIAEVDPASRKQRTENGIKKLS